MPMFKDNDHVVIYGGTVVWDGITRPNTNDDGSQTRSLKVVFEPNNPDLNLINQIGQECLQRSKWQGQLPNGARWLIGTAEQNEFEGMFTGFAVVNAKTQRVPEVQDENGGMVEAMQYGNMLYAGQKVNLVVHAYDYDSHGNKGIAVGLDGFQIVQSANAQRLNIGTSGVSTSGAFGGNQQQNQGGQNQGNQQQNTGGWGNQGGGNQQQNTGGGNQNQGNQGNQNQNTGGGNQNQDNQNQGNQGGGGGNQNWGNQNQNQPQQANNFMPQRNN